MAQGERNFHILYELAAGGAASGLSKQLKVTLESRKRCPLRIRVSTCFFLMSKTLEKLIASPKNTDESAKSFEQSHSLGAKRIML